MSGGLVDRMEKEPECVRLNFPKRVSIGVRVFRGVPDLNANLTKYALAKPLLPRRFDVCRKGAVCTDYGFLSVENCSRVRVPLRWISSYSQP